MNKTRKNYALIVKFYSKYMSNQNSF